MTSGTNCANCGTLLPAGASICTGCGARATTCGSCGSSLLPAHRFCPGCGSSVGVGSGPNPRPSFSPWDQVLLKLRAATLGEFEIQRELGRGGMAAVYLAHEIALNRKVAIKVMAPGLFMGEGMVERFRHEAVTVANLGHPNIITIHAVREFEDLYFLVMKFVNGRTLDSIILDSGPLPIPQVRAIMFQIGSALNYAHRQGVVHRDIKPANILIDDDGNAVVTDFGIAKVTQSQGHTQTGSLIGTPAFMSPEQCRSGAITPASDQYSLGIVAFELLTGIPPFSGATFDVMQAHIERRLPSIQDLRPDCPVELERAIRRMCEKDPARRFPTMAQALVAMGAAPLAEEDPHRSDLATLAVSGEWPAEADSPPPRSPIPRGPRSSHARTARTLEMASAATIALPVTSISITEPPAPLTVGETARLQATSRDAAGNEQERLVAWSSSEPGVASIDQEGELLALAPGEATISASVEGVAASVQVVVAPAAVRPSGAFVGTGAEPERRWRWVAPVVGLAAIAAVALIARSGSAPGGLLAGSGLQVARPPSPVVVGDTFLLTATPFGELRARDARSPLLWQSYDTTVVAVDSTMGLVMARAPGLTQILAIQGSLRDSVPVVVQRGAVSIVAIGQPPALVVGDTGRFVADLWDARGNRLQGLEVAWSTGHEEVLRVDSLTGRYAALSAGTASVTATVEGVGGTIGLVVAAPPSPAAPGPEPVATVRPEVQFREGLGEYVSALRAGNLDQVVSFYRPMTAEDVANMTWLQHLLRTREWRYRVREWRLTGEPRVTDETAAVDLGVRITWNDAAGQARDQWIPFVSEFVRSTRGWHLRTARIAGSPVR